MEEKIKYDEKIANKPIIERITETINLLLNQQFGDKKELTFKLTELRKTLPEAIKATKIVTYHKNTLRTALMKDLFKEMKKEKGDITKILPELRNFAEVVTEEYIIEEIEKARKTGGIAA
jgi:hypothetical protein